MERRDPFAFSTRLFAFLFTGLALSMGWGVRGQYGHEIGAMFPGALAAIAMGAMSGRTDWLQRLPYIGLFGALGWGFGGSISYMQVIGYTHSGHAPSQYYGFFCLYVIGFLWAGLGIAGTAFGASAEAKRITAIFQPLLWVFAVWLLSSPALAWFEHWESADAATWQRHESKLYWFDADWIPAATALLAMGLYDLWVRRGRGMGHLVVFSFLGAAVGYVLHTLLDWTHLSDVIRYVLVRPQVDLNNIGGIAAHLGVSEESLRGRFVYNFPDIILENTRHIGWALGALFGVVYHFYARGKFPNGASLFVYMGLGWFAGFLLFPVLLNFGGAGFRMTPPRGDDWAGILGLYGATLWWLHRHNLAPVVLASLMGAIIGGIGFAGTAFIKLLLISFGNPHLLANLPQSAEIVEAWRHWQSANWHSFLEQTYGFINGIGVAAAMLFLSMRKGYVEDPSREQGGRWTWIFAVVFVLWGIPYLNLSKNVEQWVNAGAVPAVMRAPLFGNLSFSAQTWYSSVWFALLVVFVSALWRHTKQPLPLVPEHPLGKAQWMFLLLMWVMVVGNFDRAVVHFSEGRLITEWVIAINAVVATGLVLFVLPQPFTPPARGIYSYQGAFQRALWALLLSVVLVTIGTTWQVRTVYGDTWAGHGALHKRFGPDANWRTDPLLRGTRHK